MRVMAIGSRVLRSLLPYVRIPASQAQARKVRRCRDGLESYATRQEAEQRLSSVDTAIKVVRAWVFPGGCVEVQSDHNQVEIVIVPQRNSHYVIEPKA
jgi:hypothetical protein